MEGLPAGAEGLRNPARLTAPQRAVPELWGGPEEGAPLRNHETRVHRRRGHPRPSFRRKPESRVLIVFLQNGDSRIVGRPRGGAAPCGAVAASPVGGAFMRPVPRARRWRGAGRRDNPLWLSFAGLSSPPPRENPVGTGRDLSLRVGGGTRAWIDRERPFAAARPGSGFRPFAVIPAKAGIQGFDFDKGRPPRPPFAHFDCRGGS